MGDVGDFVSMYVSLINSPSPIRSPAAKDMGTEKAQLLLGGALLPCPDGNLCQGPGAAVVQKRNDAFRTSCGQSVEPSLPTARTSDRSGTCQWRKAVRARFNGSLLGLFRARVESHLAVLGRTVPWDVTRVQQGSIRNLPSIQTFFQGLATRKRSDDSRAMER